MAEPDVAGLASAESLYVGLTDAEVAKRVAEGKSNDVPTRAARSVSEIIRTNVFTRINAILGVLFVIVLTTGSLINGHRTSR
jgi:cation-transporting ATPase E